MGVGTKLLKSGREVTQAVFDEVAELVRRGFPESTAEKIATGELPMDEASRMARAREQGFDVDSTLYHGGQSDILSFLPDRGGSVYLTDDPSIADIYAENASSRRPNMVNSGPNVMPVMVRGNFLPVSDLGPDGGNGWISDNLGEALGFDSQSVPAGRRAIALNDEARRQGVDVVEMRDYSDLGGKQTQYKVLNPQNIRSTNAAFDPDQINSPNLLAGGAAAAVGLGAATQSEDADAADPSLLAGTAIGTGAYSLSQQEEADATRRVMARQYTNRAVERKGKFREMRDMLLDGVGSIGELALDVTPTGQVAQMIFNNPEVFDYLELPQRGLLGLAQGGLSMATNQPNPLQDAARVASQPVEQTAYDVGGYVTDETGGPVLGTAANVATQMFSPM